MQALCNKCGKCVAACPEQAIFLGSEGTPQIDRERCTVCGDCLTACFPGALTMYGKEMTVAEVFREVCRDQIFYKDSGGGVTASGGEPLQQPSFVKALFQMCHEAGIHTALETTGFATRRVLEEVLAWTDYVLYDLKHLDSEIHQKFTGIPNTLILENANLIAASGVRTLFRSPLIPGVNDTPENIRETASFLKAIQGEEAALEFLPYHSLGLAKYKALGRRPYALEGVKPHDPAHVASIRRSYEELGVKCTVS